MPYFERFVKRAVEDAVDEDSWTRPFSSLIAACTPATRAMRAKLLERLASTQSSEPDSAKERELSPELDRSVDASYREDLNLSRSEMPDFDATLPLQPSAPSPLSFHSDADSSRLSEPSQSALDIADEFEQLGTLRRRQTKTPSAGGADPIWPSLADAASPVHAASAPESSGDTGDDEYSDLDSDVELIDVKPSAPPLEHQSSESSYSGTSFFASASRIVRSSILSPSSSVDSAARPLLHDDDVDQ